MVSLICLGLVAALGLRPAGAGESQLRGSVRGAINFYNDHEDVDLFMMTSKQLDQLEGGEVIKIRRPVNVNDTDTGQQSTRERLSAYVLVAQPRIQLWLAALSPDFRAIDMLTQVRAQADNHGRSVRYQHLNLPWPVSDRHWVIDLYKNTDLSAASGGRVWEHAWQLNSDGHEVGRELVAEGEADGLTVDSFDDSVYLPVNRGAWVMFALDDDHTLVAYHVIASLGGSIPEGLINNLAMTQLDNLLRGIGEFAQGIQEVYVPGHVRIYDGQGRPIPYYPGPLAED